MLAAPAWGQEPTDATGRQVRSTEVALRGVMIPTGFEGKKYTAMLQVAVDGSPLSDAEWDLGASFGNLDETRRDFAGRVTAGQPGTKVVAEFQVEFRPGPYGLTVTARERTAGQSATRTLDGRWPNPEEAPATVSPVILLQPAQGAFVRDDSARAQGALALSEDDAVRADLPTAIVSVVCRGFRTRDTVRVERRIEGVASAEFKVHELRLGDSQCAQIRDMIPPGTLHDGRFRYQLDLVSRSGKLASEILEFDAIAGARRNGTGSR